MFPDVSSALPRRNKTAITSEDGVDTAIELILNAHRYASTGLDEANELPLHWLCRNVSATVNTVDEVWQAFPDAAAECAELLLRLGQSRLIDVSDGHTAAALQAPEAFAAGPDLGALAGVLVGLKKRLNRQRYLVITNWHLIIGGN